MILYLKYGCAFTFHILYVYVLHLYHTMSYLTIVFVKKNITTIESDIFSVFSITDIRFITEFLFFLEIMHLFSKFTVLAPKSKRYCYWRRNLWQYFILYYIVFNRNNYNPSIIERNVFVVHKLWCKHNYK